MTWWAAAWRTLVVLASTASVVAGLVKMGWPVFLLATFLSATGALFGWSWSEDPPEARRLAVRGACWGGCGGLITAGLPAVMGTWTLLVLIGLMATAPDVLAFAARAADRPGARAHPEDLPDRRLLRRWRRTGARLRRPGLAPSAVLELVEERARLLDELERRDPARFGAWLAEAAGAERPERDPWSGYPSP